MDFVRTLCQASLALLVASAAFAQTSSGPWRSIGPDGGSILAIVTDPVSPNVVHVASDGGGVFRSTDNGDTWRAAKGVPVTVTPALAIAPSNHLVLYAGTNVNGIFKSVDGGASWSPTTPPLVLDSTTGRVVAVDALAVDPRDAAVVYAATRGASNVLFKTTNGGATWSPIGNLTSTQTNFIRLTGLRIDPATPDTMYGFGGVIIVKSVDAGNTWTEVQPVIPGAAATFGFRVFGLDLDPSAPSTLYAAFSNWGVYKSENAGASWTSLNATLPFVPGVFTTITLTGVAVDPQSPGTVYVSATCPVAVCPEGAVYKSTDGGKTWGGAHANQGGWNNAVIAVSRGTPAAVFAGTQCGDVSTAPGPATTGVNTVCKGTLLRSTDGGTSWSNTSTGLRIQAVADVAVDPSAPGTMLVATKRGIARTADGGATWSFPSDISGLSVRTVVAPAGPRMYAVVSGLCCGGDTLQHSSDGGQTWFGYVTPGSRPSDSGGPIDIWAIAVDPRPADPVDTVYAGTGTGLFKSADSGLTWTRLTAGSASVGSVFVRPGSPSLLVYSLGNSIFLSTDGGLTSTAMPLAGPLAWFAFDPSSVDTMYAATIQGGPFSCAAQGGLFKSIDRGVTWTYAGAGLPPRDGCGIARYAVSGLAFDPANPSRIFAALSGGQRFRPFGIYVSSDAGATWTEMPRPPAESVRPLRFAGSTLIAGTFGGSLFALDPSCPTIASPAVASVSAAGGPVSIAIDTPSSCGWSASADAAFVTVSGASGTGGGSASLVIAPNPGPPRSATVTIGGATILVNQAATELAVDRASLQFTAASNGAAFTFRTAAQSVRIGPTGPGSIAWTVTANQPWVTVSTTGGAGTATVNIGVVHTPGMPVAATLQAAITITPSGIAQGPLTVPVTLTLVPHGTSVGPFGVFDTPANNASGVTGSVPVTGWALDDIEVARVRILREPVAPEPPGALIYIGDAALVDGARPDVAAAYPAVPRKTRAGWGYLLLTNFLPGTGNGTFRLHAVADDTDGHSTDLGTKVITVDNDHATTPFGAIDSPGQGETVCGTIVNFGWALTQSPKDIPADSSTIVVFIDGIPVGRPSLRASRSDITSLFPGYVTSHAVGGFVLDTTQYSNGVHTIAWVVTDSDGKADGIGSRFFTIANPCGASVVAASAHSSALADAVAQVDRVPIDPSPIAGRRGFDLAAPMTRYAPEGGYITVHAEELDPIELRFAGSGHDYRGYVRAPAGLMPLPIGSTLDAASGTFAWTPGPGFVGTYDLVFTRWSGGHAVARQDVRIVLHPKGSDRIGPQVVIDAPSAQGAVRVVDRAFLLAGWAADLDAGFDRGVDAVHVWAYPVNARGERELPSFLGPATYGGARPDVAAIYGERFLDTGYGILARLEPGVYDLAVFAFSTVRGAFAPAQVVRVAVK